MARTSSVTLGPLQEFVDSLVRSGRYASSSEVIRDSLRLLQEKEAESKLEILRKAIEEGENSQLLEEWDANIFLTRMKQGSSSTGKVQDS
ncbi:MAG: type II toxin-antitoxin system ParD family antitoxin [Gammaproteobacteria bacterium]